MQPTRCAAVSFLGMPRVMHREVSDGSVALRWGEHGQEHFSAPDDEAALRKAYRSAVAEGLSLGQRLVDEVDRSVAREIQGEVGIAKDAGGGLIVAYWPGPEEQARFDALLPADTPGKVAPGDLHLTLLYLDDEGWSEEGSGWDLQLVAAVCKIFSTEWSPFDARVGGLGRFVGPEDADVFVALVDCERLASFRHCLEDALYCRGAVPSRSALWSPQHGFIPHVTLAYVGKGQETLPALPEGGDFEFEVDNVTLASGETRIRFALGYAYARDEAVEDPRPFYAARDAVALQKAGRVLSERNLKALEEAMSAMAAVVEAERRRGRSPEDYDEEQDTKRRAILDAVAKEASVDDAELVYAVTKASDEHRFTLGPLYAPDRKDAHGEYTDAETLQKAVWDYVRQSRAEEGRIRLQHGDLGEVTVAEWVEVVAWPYEHTIKVRTVGGDERELTMPAGTVYMGAIWDEDAWPLVKEGKIGGWSLGGKAVRVREGVKVEEMQSMGDEGVARGRAAPQDDRLALLKVAADAEAALRERELEGARKESGRLESIVGQLVDAVKTSFQRPAAPQHSHTHFEEGAVKVDLPDVDVRVNPEVKLDVVE